MHDVSTLSCHDAMRIIAILGASGHETRFVGGCVRDTLLKRPLGDIDLATTALPETVIKILTEQQINVIPTGLEYGTVMAVINGQGYEITTLRRDVTTDGRRATVAFTDNWEQDAHRRDFTVNALSVDKNGTLHDYCDGLSDIVAKNLRFIDDAASRIKEDYLRLLRLFRFASVLGWDLADTDLLALCSELAPHMQQLSRERIQAELFKLLTGQQALRIVELMDDYDIFRPWMDKINLPALADVITREQEYQLSDGFRRFIALIGYDNRVIIDEMIVLSKQQKKRLHDIEQCVALEADTWSQEKFCYLFGEQATEDCFILFVPENWSFAFFSTWEKPVFPLKAEHIMADTNGAGALLGLVLKQSENWWVDEAFMPDHDAVLSYARNLIRSL